MKHLTFTTAALAAALFLCPLAAVADLDADIAALSRYEFGSDRSAAARIETAVGMAAGAEDSGGATQAALEQKLIPVLTGDSTVEAKRFVCRWLGFIGSAACVPALAAQLASEEMCQSVLTALETNRSEAAADALIAAVSSLKDRHRIGAAASLGRQNHDKAVPVLAGLLADADPQIAQQAAESLAAMGRPEGCAALADALSKAPAANKALLTGPCVECAAETADAESARAWFTMLGGPEYPAHVRVAALGGLMKLDPAKAPELLVAALKDPDIEVSRPALGLARQTPGPEVTAALAGLLEGAATEQQAALLDVLAARGDTSAIPAAIALAKGDNAVAAIRALGRLGNADTAGFLVECAAASKGDAQTAARESLNILKGNGVDDALLDIAEKGKDPAARAQAVSSLGDRRATGKVKALLALADDKEESVASESLKSLRILAGGDDLKGLFKLLQKADKDGRKAEISRAIVGVCERIPEADKRADKVLAELEKAKKAGYRDALIGVAGQIGNGPALEALRARLAKADAVERAAIVGALASWPNATPLEDLFALVKSPTDEAERAKAFDGTLRVLRFVDNESSAALVERYQTLLASAANTQEKKAVISGVAGVAALEALDMADELAKDPELSAESKSAARRIIESVYGADPTGIRKRMEEVLADSKASSTAQRIANETIGRIQGFGDYISAWEVAGPYFVEGKTGAALFDMPFPPEQDGKAGWRIMPMGLEDARPWVAMLDKVIGGEDRVAYLRTRIWSPDARDAVVELGTNDGCKMWFNGALAHSFSEGRALQPGQDKIAVKLNQGWNTLLLAVYQQGGAWAACARVTQPDGAPQTGLRFSVREK